MASQMKLADLPIALNVNSDDILLITDTTHQVSKRISFIDLNSQLSLEDLSDYDVYLTDIQTINDQLDLIIGEGTLVHSLSDIDELITDVQDSIAAVRDSLTNMLETLRANVDTDLIHRNQIDQTVIDRVTRAEETILHAGLATGYLYVQEFKAGG